MFPDGSVISVLLCRRKLGIKTTARSDASAISSELDLRSGRQGCRHKKGSPAAGSCCSFFRACVGHSKGVVHASQLTRGSPQSRQISIPDVQSRLVPTVGLFLVDVDHLTPVVLTVTALAAPASDFPHNTKNSMGSDNFATAVVGIIHERPELCLKLRRLFFCPILT